MRKGGRLGRLEGGRVFTVYSVDKERRAEKGSAVLPYPLPVLKAN